MSQEISYSSSKGNFAPVAITTLNRIECLKTTIDSLGKCHCAECTDVFPPLRSHLNLDLYLQLVQRFLSCCHQLRTLLQRETILFCSWEF